MSKVESVCFSENGNFSRMEGGGGGGPGVLGIFCLVLGRVFSSTRDHEHIKRVRPQRSTILFWSGYLY